MSSTRTLLRPDNWRNRRFTCSGIRASRSASVPHGPASSIRRNERTVDAVPSRGSSRERLATEQRKDIERPSGDDFEEALAHQPPAQHQAALLVEEVGEVSGSQRHPLADGSHRRLEPRRHVELSVTKQDPEPVAIDERHARAPRPTTQGGAVGKLADGDPVRQPTAVPQRAPSEEPAYLRLGDDRGIQTLQRVDELIDLAREPLRQQPGVVQVTGRQVPSPDLRHGVVEGSVEEVLPGHLVDAHRDVQRRALLGAGRVRGARWEIHADSRLQHDGARLAGLPGAGRSVLVHLPYLASVRLEHEDVMGVTVHGEPLRARWRQVSVGLARMTEFQLEVGDQRAERLPIAVQSLQYDGRAAVEEVEDLAW